MDFPLWGNSSWYTMSDTFFRTLNGPYRFGASLAVG